MFPRQLTAEPFAVRQEGIQHFQSQLADHLFVHLVQFRFLPAVHHVPQKVQPFDIRLARSDQRVIQPARKAECAFHHHPVGGNGGKDIVHVRQRVQHARTVYRARQVEEHDVSFRHLFQQLVRLRDSILSRTFRYRIGFLPYPLQLPVRHQFVMLVLHDRFQVTFSHLGNAVLRVVAIHHRHIHPFHIVQVTCHQHGQRCFSRSAFLRGKGDKECFFFHDAVCLQMILLNQHCK